MNDLIPLGLKQNKKINGKAYYKRVKNILINDLFLPLDLVQMILEYSDFNLSTIILNAVERKNLDLLDLMSNWKYIGVRKNELIGEYRKYNIEGDEKTRKKYTKRFGPIPTEMKTQCDICDSMIKTNCYIGNWKKKKLMTIGTTCATRFIINTGICIKCGSKHKNKKDNYCNKCRFGTSLCIWENCKKRVDKGTDRCDKCDKIYQEEEKIRLEKEEKFLIWKKNHCIDCRKEKKNNKFERCYPCGIKNKKKQPLCTRCLKTRISNPKYSYCWDCGSSNYYYN